MSLTPKRISAAGPTLYAASRVWAQIAGGILFLATSVRISPGEFGEFAIATSIFGALSVCVGQGTYEYVIKARESKTAAPTVFCINLTTASLVSLLAIVIGMVIPHIVDGKHIGKMLTLLVPAFYLLGMNTLMESVIMKHGEITKVAAASLVTETVALGVALGALVGGAGVLALVFQRLTREGMIMATYAVTSRWKPQLVFEFAEARRALMFARNIVITRFIGMGSVAAVDVLIGALLTTADAGLFRLASRLLTMVSDVLFQPFRAVSWVSLAPLQNDKAAFGPTSVRLLEVFGVGYFAVVAGVALVAAPIFPLVFQPDWERAAPVVLALAVARLISMPTMISEVILALKNRTAFMTTAAMITIGLNVGAAYLAGPHGLVVFGWSATVVAVITVLVVMPVIARASDLPIGVYVRLSARLGLNVAAMVAVVAPWLQLAPGVGVTGWPLVLIAIVLGAMAYLLAAKRFTPVGFDAYESVVLGSLRRVRLVMQPN